MWRFALLRLRKSRWQAGDVFDLPFAVAYENMNSYSYMNTSLILCGLTIWAGATIVLRITGQRLLHPG